MKIKQIIPAPPGWLCVTLKIENFQDQSIVYPQAQPVLALALAFDEVETDGVFVPIAQDDFGDSKLVVPYERRRMVPSDTPLELFINEAEEEAERVTALRREKNPDAKAVRAMILDRTVDRARKRADLERLMQKLRDEGRYFTFPR
jgi:hypothetical protein